MKKFIIGIIILLGLVYSPALSGEANLSSGGPVRLTEAERKD